ncbi:MAG TPA: hypothetical protein EYP10_14055 [Armatimonadetes bacterium]|nr:hypothetical protein [Armatimonadota bacterium]
MELMIKYGNVVVMLMTVHLIASVLAVEGRDFRGAIASLFVQSLTLALIFATFGYLWGQPWLYAWCITALITKAAIVPYLLIHYTQAFPKREVRPLIGFRLSITLIIIFLVVFYHFIYVNISFIAPTEAALMEPAKSSLAMAFTVFFLGVWTCIVRRDVVKIVIGIVVLENGIHLALVVLAPRLPETTLIGIASNIIIAAWLLLYLSGRIYQVLGTTDSLTLSELKR